MDPKQPTGPVAEKLLGEIVGDHLGPGCWERVNSGWRQSCDEAAAAVEAEVLKRADQAGFVKAGQTIDALQRERDHAQAQEAGLRAIIERLGVENERLKSQLPEGMEKCTIKFISCPVGHGRLISTNWIDNGCCHCEIERLEAREKLAVDTIERLTKCLDHKTASEHSLIGDWQNAKDQELIAELKTENERLAGVVQSCVGLGIVSASKRIVKLEAELASLKSSATRWNAEQMDAVRQLAASLGWNGVENSKLLSVFLADFIDGLKANAVPNGKFPLSTFTWLDAACYETDAQGPYIKFAGKNWRPGSAEPAAMPVEKPTKINMEVGVVGREQPVCRDCDGHFETYQDAMRDITKILGMVEHPRNKPEKKGE